MNLIRNGKVEGPPSDTLPEEKNDEFTGILKEIDALYNEKKYDEVINLALPHINNENKKRALEMRSMAAISYFYKEDYKNSLLHYEEILSQVEKVNASTWFNVLMSAVFIKDMEKARNAFNKTMEIWDTDPNQHLTVYRIRFYYAQALKHIGLFNEALEQLEELKKTYIEFKITDDHFLYVRGVPFMPNFLDLAKEVFEGLNIDFPTSDWLMGLKEKVDKDGKEFIKSRYENAKTVPD